MKIALTGAAGFVGRHVLHELGKHRVDILVLDKCISAADFSRIELRALELAMEDAGRDSFIRLGKPDSVIHLAWGGLPNYLSLHHFDTELPLQYAFLSGLVRSNLNHLVVAGTCFEYGMQSGPLSEDLPARPGNPYGFAKDALRTQLEYLKQKHTFGLTWARLFYVYGEGQSPNSLYPQLKRAVERNQAIFNMSGGEQLRDYLPISQVAGHLVRLALDKADLGVVIVCSGKPVSVRGLVEQWLKENGWDIRLNLGHYPYPGYELFAFWGDRAKLDRYLECRSAGR